MLSVLVCNKQLKEEEKGQLTTCHTCRERKGERVSRNDQTETQHRMHPADSIYIILLSVFVRGMPVLRVLDT